MTCIVSQRLSPVQVNRFWSHVDKGGPVPAHCPELGNCWLWTRSRNRRTGYGMVGLQGKSLQVHRVAYVLANGPIPDRLLVMHRCDFPPCCRPSHLMVGDNLSNRLDCIAKGRANMRHGQLHHDAKLTDDAVRDIRRRCAAGETCRALALEYGVAPGIISTVSTGRSWKHVV